MKSTGVPTVFIVDDDASVRESVQDLIESVGLRCEPFATPQQFLDNKHGDSPSCLVLDVRLPGMSGLDFQQKLNEAGIRIPIIFITGHGDIPMSVQAMKSGAVEFLTKPFREQELLDAIHVALERNLAVRQEQSEAEDLQKRYATLTGREREVMNLVITGMPNKLIAAELGSSEPTVKIQRGRVMEKMQAASVVELVRIADKIKLASKS